MDINDAGTALYKLLPTGSIWPDEIEDTNLKNLMYGLGGTIEGYITTLKHVIINQFYPDTAGMFLEDWEQLLGLPKCGQSDQSIQDRLTQVMAMQRISPYSNAQFFIDIAAIFGFTISVYPDAPATITLSGAGTGAWNQEFLYVDIYNGKARYSENGASSGPFKMIKYNGATMWLFTNEFGGTDYINRHINGFLPPNDDSEYDGWSGSSPAPTIAYGVLSDPFKITVQVDSTEVLYFRAGMSAAGDPLQTSRANSILECILNFFKPAHSHIVYT